MRYFHPQVAYADSRGEIKDLVQDDGINAVTIVTFTAGAVRANHYHKQTTQWNYVLSGKLLLVTETEGEGRKETILSPGDLAMTPPNEGHALKALEDSSVLILAKGPRSGTDYESDTYRLPTPLIN